MSVSSSPLERSSILRKPEKPSVRRLPADARDPAFAALRVDRDLHEARRGKERAVLADGEILRTEEFHGDRDRDRCGRSASPHDSGTMLTLRSDRPCGSARRLEA